MSKKKRIEQLQQEVAALREEIAYLRSEQTMERLRRWNQQKLTFHFDAVPPSTYPPFVDDPGSTGTFMSPIRDCYVC